ncbi:hypothetical protein [Aquimarina sediminis]|uniref:hypothetical protein n=1 Tax=Aquimarina sediminis TaxID=2070536 RepID=UPI0013E8CB87|nr:hypothetical protein [Aquimarina sediminis]
MSKKEKPKRKRRFADFQNKYRRSSNFGYGSKRDRFAIAGNGELLASSDDLDEEQRS